MAYLHLTNCYVPYHTKNECKCCRSDILHPKCNATDKITDVIPKYWNELVTQYP